MEKKLLKRVEEMDDTEREKLRQLLKDGKKSDSSKINWMYNDKADDEEYLLGKRIEKSVLAEPDDMKKDAPGALFGEVIARRSELDMQVKMREDPLYMIRKMEEESRRRVLENPVKMKQLQKAVEQHRTVSAAKPKKKKKHRSKSRDSTSDSDSGDDLLKKYLSIVKQKKTAQKDSHAASLGRDKCSDSSTGSKVRHGYSEREQKHHRTKDDNRSGSRDRSRQRTETGSGSFDRMRDASKDTERDHRNHSDRSADRKRHHDDRHDLPISRHLKGDHKTSSKQDRRSTSRSRSRSPTRHKPAGYGLIKGNSEQVVRRTTEDTGRKSPVRASSAVQSKPVQPPVKRKKLTAEEMERKRADMMSNARHHDDQRRKNIELYKHEDEREKQRLDEQLQTYDPDFVKPLMVSHADQSSVEERIKRNKYNIQRTGPDLDKNFARR